MQIKWTNNDMAWLRSGEFLRGIARLPKRTRTKVVNAICSTSDREDLLSTFDSGRLDLFKSSSLYQKNVSDLTD